MKLTRVEIVRQSVRQVVAMLAQRKILVTQIGTQAFVQYDRRGVPARVNIPYLPDNASEDLLIAVQGFIDHEVGHILFTDPRVKTRAEKAPCMALYDVLEDTRIERKMKQRFKGSGRNLGSTWSFIQERITKPDYERALKSGSEKAIQAALIVAAVRAWAGQKEAQDFMADKWHHFESFKKVVGEDLIEKISTLNTSMDAFTLAAAMHNRIEEFKHRKEEEERRKEEKRRKREEEGCKGKSSKSPGGGEGGAGGEPEEPLHPDDEGDETRDGVNSDGPGKPKSEPDSEGEDEGSESEGESAEPDEEETKEESGDKSEKALNTGGSHPNDAEDEGSEEEESDGERDEDVEDSEDDSEEDESEEESEEGEDEKESEEEDGEADEEEDESVGGSDGGSASEDDKESYGDVSSSVGIIPDEIKEVLDSARDLDTEVTTIINKAILSDLEVSEYTPLTKDFDRIELFVPKSHDHADALLKRMEERCGQMVGLLQKRFERMIAAKSYHRMVPGFKSGRLHGATLYRIPLGDERIFRRKIVSRTKDVALSLVVDLSGSMYGEKVELALLSAFGMSMTLDRMNIKHEVIGFTTCMHHLTREQNKRLLDGLREFESAMGRRPSRVEPIYMPIFKDFNQRFTADRRRAMALAPYEIRLSQNTDGESLEYAAARLMARPEARKIMIVLSDGEPCGGYGSIKEQAYHLKKVVRRLIESGVDVFGIGIMTSAVEAFYPAYEIIHDLSDLPGTVMATMEKMLVR